MQEAQAYFLSMGPDNVNRTDRSLVVNCTGLCGPSLFQTAPKPGGRTITFNIWSKGRWPSGLTGGNA